MKRILFKASFVAIALFAAPVFAQDAEDVQSRHYDFNDMLIDGEFQRPTGIVNTARGQARFDALLNLRRSFIDEIEESAQENALD